jgi:5-methylcytosine-specific restriction enzyme subunit McrC
VIPTPDTATVGYIGRIPVRNIWLLMLYASDLYRELPPVRSVAVEDAPDDIPNLVAELLTHAVERRLRRNLTIGYQRREADLNRVRGRINLLRTERRQLLQRGRVACIFDELTVDTPRNRFVRAALLELAKVVQKPELARSCRVLAASMERAGVKNLPTETHRGHREFPLGRLGRLDAADRQMLAAARLAFDLALPTEDAGMAHFTVPDREERWARKLFEAAVGGFYNVVLPRNVWNVRTGSKMRWHYGAHTLGIPELLPSMQTDIVLERECLNGPSKGQRIVIDTKFTSIVSKGRYGNQSLKSDHIYQLYSYLRSQENTGDPMSYRSAGVLLYPAIDTCIDEAAVIQGHEVRFATVNLADDGQTIRRQLLRVVDRSPLTAVS